MKRFFVVNEATFKMTAQEWEDFINNSHYDKIETYLKHGWNINSILHSYQGTGVLGKGQQETALTTAVTIGESIIVNLLLKNKANPNILDYDGNSPLMFAIENDEKKIFDLLLHYGADPNFKDGNGTPPIVKAADKYLMDKHYFNELIKHKVDVNAQAGDFYEGKTALHVLISPEGKIISKSAFNFLKLSHIDPLIKDHNGLRAIDYVESKADYKLMKDYENLYITQIYGKDTDEI